MTRTAILSAWVMAAFVAALPAISQTKPEQQSEAKQEKPDAPPAQSPKATIPASGGSADKTYVIGAEDILRIQVWGDPRLSGDFIVRPDGRISMNLINEVQAAGKTCLELGNLIGDRLKAGEFMRNPSVNVQVMEVRSKKYYINGEVNKPGQYFLVTPTTVLEALNNAGGFRDFANKKKIKVLRTVEDGMKEFPFDYNSVIRGKKIEENILLKPGDQIIVP
jgi:polysaccharide biosynthesis/export protein